MNYVPLFVSSTMRQSRNKHYLGFLRGICFDVDNRAQEPCERFSLNTE